MDYKQEGQAEWDGRQAFLERLHKNILHCYEALYNNNYEYWYKALTVMKIELSNHIRGEEEKEKVEKAMKKIKSALYVSNNSINKFETFMKAQEELHGVMRRRGFDIPINERRPEHVLR